MPKKQYILILVLALIGGLIGGALSNKIFVSNRVYAENRAKRKIIDADEFRVIDENGDVIARFGRRGGALPFLRMGKEHDNHQVELSAFGLKYSDKERYTSFSSSGIKFGEFSRSRENMSLKS